MSLMHIFITGSYFFIINFLRLGMNANAATIASTKTTQIIAISATVFIPPDLSLVDVDDLVLFAAFIDET